MKKFFKHQKEVVDEDKHKCGIFFGTGGGKTATALGIAEGITMVVAPKTQVQDRNWQREWIEMQKSGLTNVGGLIVVSKEEFRRDWDELPKVDTLIFDEVHTIVGVQPTQGWVKRERVIKTSQVFSAAQGYIKKHRPKRVYAVTATPVRNPMCVWGIATLLGYSWDFVKFRDAFYYRLPMPGREVYRPRSDEASKVRLAKAVQKLGYTGRLDDWFDVPPQIDKVVYVHPTPAQEKRIKQLPIEYPDPLVLLGKMHQVENGVLAGDEYKEKEEFSNEKINYILDLAVEFDKVLVFAKYLNQIEAIKTALQKAGKTVYTLTGDTKNRGELLRHANESESCVLIAQSSISAGYEVAGPTKEHPEYVEFPCIVYASMSYSLVDLEQSRGRVLRANALKKNLYIYLVLKDGIDEEVYKTLMTKKDFNEAIFIKEHPNLV